jgi:peptide/nickel transport system substrate-binding protein
MEHNPDEVEFDTTDFKRWQLSRRDVLRSSLLAGGVVAAGGLLAACKGGGAQTGGGSTSGTSGSGGAASKGSSGTSSGGGGSSSVVPSPRSQTVIIDQGPFTVYDSFNPLIPNGENYQNGVTQCAKEFPFYLNMATGKLIYWQGKSWSYNSDYTECTITLRPDVKWSDGKPCTSADVVYTAELCMQHASAIGGGLVNTTWVSEVKSVTAKDAQSTVFKLNTSDPRFHYNFVCQIVSASFLILPKHIWSSQTFSTFKNDPPIYTGPYVLDKANENEGYILWKKSTSYWAKSMMDPNPPYVAFRNAPTDADLENEQFKQGVTDYNASSTAYQYGVQLQKAGEKTVQITNFVDSDQRTIIVNCDPSRGALADPRFRYAISCLIDRQKVIENIWPVPTVADVYPWPSYPNTKTWDNASIANQFAKYRQYNPTLAGQLLDELGIKKSGSHRQYKGKDLSLQVITPASSSTTQAPEYLVGQLLVEELESIGISSSIKQPSSAVYTDLLNKGQYDIRSEWFGGAILDQYQLYEQFSSQFYEPIGQNALSYDQMRLKEPAFDTTINKLRVESPTASSTVPTYNTALTQFYTYQPIIPYLQTVYSHVSSNKYWTGWPTDTDLYQIPSNWWAQFLFVIGKLKPAS